MSMTDLSQRKVKSFHHFSVSSARLRVIKPLPESQICSRIRVYIPQKYHKEPIISKLISDHSLVVNVVGAILDCRTAAPGQFDLELHGTAQQVSQGLQYLQSHAVKVIGKANAAGDSWYC